MIGLRTAATPNRLPWAIERCQRDSRRLLEVLDRQLQANEYPAGDYSIADIATRPRARRLPVVGPQHRRLN